MKGEDKYNEVSTSDDYTIAERQIKEWVQRAKNKNQEEPENSNAVWWIEI